MRILVLDDDEMRHSHFRNVLAGHSVNHVRTYREACEALESEKYDLAYLDHDLDDYINFGTYGETEFTGYDVVRFICKELSPENRPLRIIVHSWNPDGARNMTGMLIDYGFWTRQQPFDTKVTGIDISTVD